VAAPEIVPIRTHHGKAAGVIFRSAALFSFKFEQSRESSMSDLFVTKQLDGYAATFLRFVGPDNFVIEVNGAERTVSREFWRALRYRDAKVTLTG
jgi:hypothetical protein